MATQIHAFGPNGELSPGAEAALEGLGGGGGTVTATDTPTVPAEGASASYLVTSAVVWPAGLVWSTDPDGGTAPTITDAALVSLFTVGGTTYAVMGSTFPTVVIPDPEDETPPTPGTLAASAITGTSFTLTVTGATDETALHAAPYAFSTDNGVTYSAWQASNVYVASELTAETAYDCVHKVRDAAENVATGTAIEVTTTTDGVALGAWNVVSDMTLSGEGVIPGASDGGLAWRSTDLPTLDGRVFTMQAVPSASCVPCLVLRYVDASNFVYCSWTWSNNTLNVYAVNEGVHTQKGTASHGSPTLGADGSVPRYFKASISGDVITVFKADGVTVGLTATVTEHASATSVGVRKGGTQSGLTDPWLLAVT